MLVDRYSPEDVVARVPELAGQTDPVLVQLDQLLDDAALYQQVRSDLAQRYRLTPVHGRHSTPVEVLPRLLVVQHLYASSDAETVERVADLLVLRWFCRVYFRRAPTKTTLLRWAATIQPATLQALVDRASQLARQAHVTRARKLRIDSTCVRTTIHHPTDNGVLGDGVRVLTRLIHRAQPLVQTALATVCDALRSRLRTSRRLLQQRHRVRRLNGDAAAAQQRALYRRLLTVTRQALGQAQQVRDGLRAGIRAGEARLAPATSSARARMGARLATQLDRFLPLVRHAIQQAQRRVLDGPPVASTEKVFSLFEPHTRVVKRGKLSAAAEFGRQVVRDEVEGGIVTRFQVLADDESECRQAGPAIQHHHAVFGRPPWLVTGDRRLHTKDIEETAQGPGVTHVVIPRMGRLTAVQRTREKRRSWRRRYRWRAGLEGRSHSLRRDCGLLRGRSHGLVGLARDVGWGLFASDLRHLAAAQARRTHRTIQRAA